MPSEEEDKVIEWRMLRLLEAGYPPKNAEVLANHVEIDLHLACRLVEEGCPPQRAVRILL